MSHALKYLCKQQLLNNRESISKFLSKKLMEWNVSNGMFPKIIDEIFQLREESYYYLRYKSRPEAN